MDGLLRLLEQLPPLLVYVVAALIVAAETATIIGLLMPGEATLLMVGFLAYLGTLRLVPTVIVMVAAAVVGDAIAFRSGRRYGPRVRASRLGQRVGEQRWARADAMLHRLGGRGVLAARWVAFVRTLLPRLAGSAGMPYQRFAPWNVVGVATWVTASVLVGYLAGTSYETVSRIFGRATGAVIVLLVAIVAIVLVGRWLGRNPDPVRALFARAARLPPLRWLGQRYGVLFFLLSMHIGAGWALLINLVAGVALLFVVGLGLAWVTAALVRHSGLSLVDTTIATWIAAHRANGVTDVALTVVSVLRGSVLIVLVALIALVLGWRARAWRADLVSVLGTAGAFVPLVVLAVVADLAQPGEPDPVSAAGFPTQNAVVTAGFCTLAWLLARRAHWSRAVAAWTVAAVGVVTISAARLYLGWDSASESVTAVLLGVLWTVVFMVAWATRDRATNEPSPTTPRRAEPVSGRS
ncbi:MAG TPA: DedA family protein [Micromonosporaceae bacterium]